MSRSPLFWAVYGCLLLLSWIAKQFGCYVVREGSLHQVVTYLVHIQRMRHRHPVGKLGSERQREDDYVGAVLAELRHGVVPRRLTLK